MSVDWGKLLTILTGIAGSLGAIYAVIKALRTTPGEIRSADAMAAKSYAEAAKLSAEQASSITQRNNALEEALRRTNTELQKQEKRIGDLEEQQAINMKRITDLENENGRLLAELNTVKEENKVLTESLKVVQDENRKLKEQYEKTNGGNEDGS